MTDDHGCAARLAVPAAIEAALDDPVRLLHAVTGAEDDEDAVRRILEAYEVDPQVARARALLGLRFGRFTRADRARLTAELRILRAGWGPPATTRLAVTGDVAAAPAGITVRPDGTASFDHP